MIKDKREGGREGGREGWTYQWGEADAEEVEAGEGHHVHRELCFGLYG